MGSAHKVTVFGAYGHTGRFVVAELLKRGLVPVLSGRDADKLAALAAALPEGAGEVDVRPASVDDAAALDRAVDGAHAVINCAGPFATTSAPIVEAALCAGIPYLDVAAEIEANVDTFADFADRAREAGTVVVPAMAFYGGLGDLLATAAMGDWTSADEAHVSYGLSSWQPTTGTLASGVISRERRGDRRVRYANGRLEYVEASELPTLEWEFPEPLGRRPVLGEFTMADVVTIPSHLDIPEVRTYMSTAAAGDLAAATPVDEHGRTAETFVVDVIVRTGDEERRAIARGEDIYAVTAPLVVEATQRILAGEGRTIGVASAGELFDATDFLKALSPHVSVEL